MSFVEGRVEQKGRERWFTDGRDLRVRLGMAGDVGRRVVLGVRSGTPRVEAGGVRLFEPGDFGRSLGP
jgi:hypothetical protein